MEQLLHKLSIYYKELVNSKSKSKIKYLYSELVYFFTMKLALYIRTQKIKQVDKKSIKKYFDLYGTEATLNNYRLTAETLIEILGWKIENIDLKKFLEFKGRLK